MAAYFITSTGTGVGKTFTTCALLHAARMAGKPARGLKPVMSGWDEHDPTNDVGRILEASSGGKPSPLAGEGLDERAANRTEAHLHTPSPNPLPQGERASPVARSVQHKQQCGEEISLYRFTAPLSPHRAAAIENREVDVDALINWTKEQVRDSATTFIETVGGVMVPLTERKTTLDWMQALNLPLILVVGSYLGTISHTLTTLEVLRARGLKVAALIINETEGSSVTLAETEAGLTPFIRDIALRIVQPRVSSWREAHAIHALAGQL